VIIEDVMTDKITLHGLGFVQVQLQGNQRLHVWHPELPRRAIFEHSAIHVHRFNYRSRVIWWSGAEERFGQVFRQDRPYYRTLDWSSDQRARQKDFDFDYLAEDIAASAGTSPSNCKYACADCVVSLIEMTLGQMLRFAEIRNSSLSLRLEACKKWIVLCNNDFRLFIVIELTTGYVDERTVQVKPYV
jgi:hypothetical protein